MGYFLAGWRVIGVDKNPQPDYPFEFHQMDIRDITSRMFRRAQAVFGSPPCQVHSPLLHAQTRKRGAKQVHVDMIPETRALMEATGLPYVMENVPGAPLIEPVTLCGSMFNLHNGRYELKRHRAFESNWDMGSIPEHSCGNKLAVSVAGGIGNWGGKYYAQVPGAKRRGYHVTRQFSNTLMGTYWINDGRVTSQAIPPVYTAFIGTRLIRTL
jgi:DNA (cytosine-5)-methyltransferase 1